MRMMRYFPLWIVLAGAATAVTLTSSLGAADRGASSLVPESRGAARATADTVDFRAIMVVASDEGDSDPSLAEHEATLRRVLRFKSYQRVGGGASRLPPNGEGTLSLGNGYNLDLWITSVTDEEIVFGIRWFKGELTLANTKVTRPRRANTVVGGPRTEDGRGTYAVIVTTL